MAVRVPDKGEMGVTFTSKSNATAIVDGSAVNGSALASSSTQYYQATIFAIKPGAAATNIPGANAGDVWICGSATSLAGAFKLVPGASMELPHCGDLSEYFLAVENANDAVSIAYTVSGNV